MNIEKELSKTCESHILLSEKSKNTSYYQDFIDMIECLEHHLKAKSNGRRILKDIVGNKLQIGKRKFDYKQYIQGASEVTVVAFFLKKFADSFIYEPSVNRSLNRNVECQFKDNIYKFNIEVKTPDFSTQEEQKKSDSIKISSMGRFDDYFDISDELKPLFKNESENLYHGEPVIDQKRMDNNAKNFLCDAHDKFPEFSGKNCLNILVICLDDLDSIDEWSEYFHYQKGFFKPDSFVPHKEFNRVDLVVFTNLYCKHNRKVTNCDNSWFFEKCFNLASRNMYAQLIKPEATIVANDIITNYTEDFESYIKNNPIPIFQIKHFYHKELKFKLDYSLF